MNSTTGMVGVIEAALLSVDMVTQPSPIDILYALQDRLEAAETAVGMMAAAACPALEMSPDDPVGMAHSVVAEARRIAAGHCQCSDDEALAAMIDERDEARAEVERLRSQANTYRDKIESLQVVVDTEVDTKNKIWRDFQLADTVAKARWDEMQKLLTRAEAAEATLASCNRARQAAEAECERLRAQVAQANVDGANEERSLHWMRENTEIAALRKQVAVLQTQLQDARTERREVCKDYNELLEKTGDW